MTPFLRLQKCQARIKFSKPDIPASLDKQFFCLSVRKKVKKKLVLPSLVMHWVSQLLWQVLASVWVFVVYQVVSFVVLVA